MAHKVENVVIVGGGTSGWMAAAAFAKFHPDKKVTLIESPVIPTIGVGESTVGGFREWLQALDIDERDFMRKTDASFKLSIEFTDFYEKNSGSFHYPFGQPCTDGTVYGVNDWHIKKYYNPETSAEDYVESYYPGMQLVKHNRYTLNQDGKLNPYSYYNDPAYHFDAVKFANWLREDYCLPKGTNLIRATVVEVTTGDIGVESLLLDSGDLITADLYIDCTGFKSLLLGDALQEPFESFEHIIPNNRAWVAQIPFTDKEKELKLSIQCYALKNGWTFTTPLWSRIGFGYIYSDKFTTPEDALQEFKDWLNSDKLTVHNPNRVTEDIKFRDIQMKCGIYKRTWVKNVVAIGMSAGFLEPLESNALYTVHEFLEKLTRSLQRPKVTQWDRDTYNFATRSIFTNFAEFVAMHYSLSIRDDSEYWRYWTEKSFSPESGELTPTLSVGFTDLMHRKMFSNQHDPKLGIHAIATGMDYLLINEKLISYVKKESGVDLKEQWEQTVPFRTQLKKQWETAALNSPTLFEYLSKEIFN